MAKRIFTCRDISLDHMEVLRLKSGGLLELGINNGLAATISSNGLGPNKTTAAAAFHFWNWVASGLFLYSIYLSFSWAWWSFIPGGIVMKVIYKANKNGNSENLLDAALIDQEFYERVRQAGGWLYQMEEVDGEGYRLKEPQHSL